jgi:hypothetical protein
VIDIYSNCTNQTHRKGTLENLLQEIEAQELITMEELLQDLPSLEDQLAEVERLTKQMEKELEAFLNE